MAAADGGGVEGDALVKGERRSVRLRRALYRPWDSGMMPEPPEAGPQVVASCGGFANAQTGFGKLSGSCAREERYIIPERIKTIGPVMDAGRLREMLKKCTTDDARVAERLYEGMQSVRAFRAEFVRDQKRERRKCQRSKLPSHIFEAAVKEGILVPLPRRVRPVAAAPLKAVADRKVAGTGRLIYPACAVNDMCRDPDPCPLPRLPTMIENVLNYPYGFTCDLRSWFYAFTMARSVASKFFVTYDSSGRPYAHVRGPMGFAHMPTLATSVAQVMIWHAIQGLDAYGVAWIDDITIVARTRVTAELARTRFVELARWLCVEVRDLTDVSQTLTAVGIEYDLKLRRWRLQRAWCEKVTSSEQMAGGVAGCRVKEFLREAGRIAWATYCLQVPYGPFVDALREAGTCVDEVIQGRRKLEDVVRVSPQARRALQRGLALVRANPWRKLAAEATATIVSDASTTGLGWMYEERRGRVVEWSKPTSAGEECSGDHISIREAVALRIALCRQEHVGRTVACVTDNSVLFWTLYTRRTPRSAGLAREIDRLYRWCYAHRVTVEPWWLSTKNMSEVGADGASRSVLKAKKYVSSVRLSECMRRARDDTASLMQGCEMPRRRAVLCLPAGLVARLYV